MKFVNQLKPFSATLENIFLKGQSLNPYSFTIFILFVYGRQSLQWFSSVDTSCLSDFYFLLLLLSSIAGPLEGSGATKLTSDQGDWHLQFSLPSVFLFQVSSCPISFLTSSRPCPYVILLAGPFLQGILSLSPRPAQLVIFAWIYFSP